MRNVILLMLSIVFLSACAGKSMQVEVNNTSSIDRVNETVEILRQTVVEQLALPQGGEFIIFNEAGEQVPYQILSEGKLIFQSTIKAGSKAVYTIQAGKPDAFEAKVFGRHIPERKDDFAWENNRVVFRMYGPALANENPSNGVDFWLKRTEEMIIDKFYHDELQHGKSYHVDHGQGLDCYKVGHTLGAGGIAPYYDDTLWLGNHYDSFRIIENGPLRFAFELTYDSISVAGKGVKQTVLISLDANSQMNRAEVTYGDSDIAASLQAAAGIFLHDVIDVIKTDKAAGYIAYAENAVSDAGLASGRNYLAVVLPGMKDIKQDNIHVLAIADYQKENSPLTYYFGGGWSKFGFETDDSWFNYVENFAQSVQQPLVVSVLK